MADREPDPAAEPAAAEPAAAEPAATPGGRTRRGRRAMAAPLGLLFVLAAVAAIATTALLTNQGRPPAAAPTGSGGPAASTGAGLGSSALPSAVAAIPGATSRATSVASASPAAADGSPGATRIAVIDENGNLATMDAQGGSLVAYPVPGVAFQLPAWSPDGTRFAVVGHGQSDTAIYVFTVPRDGHGGDPAPAVIYRSADRPPFYVYWRPDGKSVGFLATEGPGISLRVAPADGSAPVDGSGPGAFVRQGAPLFFAWESASRLLLHVGDGAAAYAGEVGPDGTSLAPALPGTGDFRAAGVSHDLLYVAYAHALTDGSGEIVVAARDGTSPHRLSTFGPAAFVFDPVGDTLASIAAGDPASSALGFPLGPLRLTDPRSGAVRTLIDGSVFAFFWAPDGRTIAALRLAPPAQQASDGLLVLAAAGPTAAPTPAAAVEVHLEFVDVTSGTIRAEQAVQPATRFVNDVVPYFDQYALSHRLWSPDSRSILLPLNDSNGRSQLVIVPSDGSARRPIAGGVSGFWSP